MNADWTLRIERLQTQLQVGIYEHELPPQAIWVSLRATGDAEANPESIEQCLDYEPLCHWLTQIWPHSPHTPLLETRVNEVIAHVFAADARIHHVWVGLYKQAVSEHARAVGIERACTRQAFDAATRSCAAPNAATCSLA